MLSVNGSNKMALNKPEIDEELFRDCLVSKRKEVKKGWGSFQDGIGEVFVYHKEDFHDLIHNTSKNPTFDVGTVKLLYVAKDKRLSTHFHLSKQEIFFLVAGSLKVVLIRDGIEKELILVPGDCILIPPGLVHWMEGIEEQNILLEVSTLDKPEDSFRIKRGH